MVPENIPPQDRLTEIQSGSGGLQKPKFLKEKYEAEPKFSGGEGFNLKKTFCGTGMDIFWNNALHKINKAIQICTLRPKLTTSNKAPKLCYSP